MLLISRQALLRQLFDDRSISSSDGIKNARIIPTLILTQLSKSFACDEVLADAREKKVGSSLIQGNLLRVLEDLRIIKFFCRTEKRNLHPISNK